MSDERQITHENVVGALVREIIRVAEKRARWRIYARDSSDSMLAYQPGIHMMTQGLDVATRMIETEDVIGCIRAFEYLRGFAADD